MATRDLKKLGAADDINRIQDYVETALRPIIGCPLIDGVLLTGISLANGVTTVEHKLGRKLRGFIVVDKNADANIWRSAEASQLSTKSLILHSDAACTVSLWCF